MVPEFAFNLGPQRNRQDPPPPVQSNGSRSCYFLTRVYRPDPALNSPYNTARTSSAALHYNLDLEKRKDFCNSWQGSVIYFFPAILISLAHFLRQVAQKTGLSAPIFWLRQKDFRCNPLCPTAFCASRNLILYREVNADALNSCSAEGGGARQDSGAACHTGYGNCVICGAAPTATS
jgi:hypothetical protein